MSSDKYVSQIVDTMLANDYASFGYAYSQGDIDAALHILRDEHGREYFQDTVSPDGEVWIVLVRKPTTCDVDWRTLTVQTDYRVVTMPSGATLNASDIRQVYVDGCCTEIQLENGDEFADETGTDGFFAVATEAHRRAAMREAERSEISQGALMNAGRAAGLALGESLIAWIRDPGGMPVTGAEMGKAAGQAIAKTVTQWLDRDIAGGFRDAVVKAIRGTTR